MTKSKGPILQTYNPLHSLRYQNFLRLAPEVLIFLAVWLVLYYVSPGFTFSLLFLTVFIFRKDFAEARNQLSTWDLEALKSRAIRRKPEN